MATGYTRQSSAQIVNGNVINDSDFNNEYNQIQAFANGASGHDHSGGTGLGPRINLTASTPGVTGVLDAQFGGIHTDTVDPTSTSDSAHGYVKGCTWVNTVTNTIFKCAVDTPTAAIWTKIIGIAGTANQISTSTLNGITTLQLSSTLVAPGTVTINPTGGAGASGIFSTTSVTGLTNANTTTLTGAATLNGGLTVTPIAGTSAVLATTSVTGLTNTGLTTLSGGLTVSVGAVSASLNTTSITGLTTTQVATMAGLTSSGAITANAGLTVNTAAGTSAVLNTTSITGLTTTQVATMAGLTSSGLITANGGLTVNTGTTGSTFNTTQINGLTATLLGALTMGAQKATGGEFQNPIGTYSDLGSISGTVNVDLSTANSFKITQNNAAITVVFGNNSSYAASGKLQVWEVHVIVDSTPHTITFQRSAGNAVTFGLLGAPTLSASKELVVLFWTVDGGTTVKAIQQDQY